MVDFTRCKVTAFSCISQRHNLLFKIFYTAKYNKRTQTWFSTPHTKYLCVNAIIGTHTSF